MAADLVELRMNVAALKRVDPYIKDILGTATQVALYTFSALKNEWEKTEVEGALFVCSRNGEPYNSILIMNRLNTNNLVEPIVKDLDWQMQAPFLLYRNPRHSIFGIWFYNRDECVKTTYLLETIMDSINKQDKVKTKKSTEGSAQSDIFSMLSKAQADFNKTPIKTESQIVQPQASTPRAPDVTSQSVMDFFAKASTTKKTHPTPVRIPTGENEPLQPLLHRLMSNPAHSVEHIEKQQRAVTPQDQQGISVLRTNKTISNKLETSNKNSSVLNLHDITAASVSTISAAAPPLSIEKTNHSLIENGINFMSIASPTTSSPRASSHYLHQPVTVTDDLESKIQESRNLSSPLTTRLDNPQKPQLMPPMMFATPDPINEKEIIEPMTKKQMAQAFIYLLKNDPNFLNTLHEGYIKSLSFQ